MPKYWGEIPKVPDPYSGIAALELEQITRIRPLDIDVSKLFQPTLIYQGPSRPIINMQTDDHISFHTVKLINHYRTVAELIESAQEQMEASEKKNEPGPSTLPPAPPIPELEEDCVIKHRRPGDVRGIDRDSSDFVKGIGTPPPVIEWENMNELVKMICGLLANHAGYDNVENDAVAKLAAATHAYFKRICYLLRINRDREAQYGPTGFIDVLETTFEEMGLGSTSKLHFYYQSKIVDFYEHMKKRCQDIMNEYEKLRVPEVMPVTEKKPEKVKDEPALEIKFPVTEEVEETQPEASQIPLQLEEFQGALQNIETDGTTTLKEEESMKWPPGQIRKENISRGSTPNLDPDDEIANSPALSTTEEMDISQSLPSAAVSETLSPTVSNTDSRSLKAPKKKKKKI